MDEIRELELAEEDLQRDDWCLVMRALFSCNLSVEIFCCPSAHVAPSSAAAVLLLLPGWRSAHRTIHRRVGALLEGRRRGEIGLQPVGDRRLLPCIFEFDGYRESHWESVLIARSDC